MTTDPGDLVLDITCGSGTTACVAERWGRRWITCDTSRVPIALARQRLLTVTFPYYKLKSPQAGPAGGFVYERKHSRKVILKGLFGNLLGISPIHVRPSVYPKADLDPLGHASIPAKCLINLARPKRGPARQQKPAYLLNNFNACQLD